MIATRLETRYRNALLPHERGDTEDPDAWAYENTVMGAEGGPNTSLC